MAAKNTNTVKSEQFQNDKQGSGRAILARLYWLLLGNVILICTAVAIYKNHKIFSWLDIFYSFIALSMAYIRYFDIKYWGGETSTGEAATMSDWRKYALFLIIAALAVLVVVHVLSLV